jgi:ABC-type transport system involved in cytochrome bd biosynthesis fused ATPase/permease subunit
MPPSDATALDVQLRAVTGASDVRSLCLDVPAGERVALTGTADGARTALLRAVAGLHPVTGGAITVGGRGNRTPAERAWRSRACAWLPSGLDAVGPTRSAGGTVLTRSWPPPTATPWWIWSSGCP